MNALEFSQKLESSSGGHTQAMSIESLAEIAQSWMAMSLDDQTAASMALLEKENFEEAKQQLLRARSKLERAQIAINDACEMCRRRR